MQPYAWKTLPEEDGVPKEAAFFVVRKPLSSMPKIDGMDIYVAPMVTYTVAGSGRNAEPV